MAKAPETRDPLTGLPKKAEFDELLASALSGSGDVPVVSLAFVDIDNFTEVNERGGHAKGDQVILSVAEAISSELKDEKPQVSRIGGDEFAVILKGTEKEVAFLRLEQVRKVVAGPDKARGDAAPTVSIGLATYPDDGTTRQEIVRKADDALFRAKSGGRNRVGLAREEKMVPKTSHFTQGQLERLSTLSTKEGVGEAELLREALDDLLKKYLWSRGVTAAAEPETGHPRKRKQQQALGGNPVSR